MNSYYWTFKKRSILQGTQTALLVLILLSFSMTVSAQLAEYDLERRPVYALRFLSFASGYDEKTFLEIFYQIPTTDLQFIKFKEGFFASYELSIALYDLDDVEVVRASIIDSVKVQTFDDIDRPRPPGLILTTFLVEPGEYEARFSLTDLETLRTRSVRRETTVPDYVSSGLKLSDLQISHSITRAEEKSLLVKSDWRILPNVLGVFGTKNKRLHVYSEVYNLSFRTDKTNKGFIATYTIKDKNGVTIKSFGRPHQKNGDTCTLISRLPIEDLADGEYQLHLVVEDPDSTEKVHKSRIFYVIKDNPEVVLYSNLLDKEFN